MKEKFKKAAIYTSEVAVAIAIVGAIGYHYYSSWVEGNKEHEKFMALDTISVDAPAELSGLTLGDVFCSSVKKDGEYDYERERSIKEPIRVQLADGRTVRIDCHNYEP